MPKLIHVLRVILAACLCAALVPFAAAGLVVNTGIPITTDSQAAKMDFIAGQAALDAGDGAQANVLFRAAIDKDPQFAYAWNNLANAAFSTQEFSASLNKARAVAADASKGEQLLIEINLRFLDNDFARQLELANELVKAYPNDARAWTTLANVQANQNLFEQQRASLKKAMEVTPGFTPAYATMGASYIFNEPKDFDMAEKYCAKAVKMEPAQDNHYWGLGDVYRAKSDLDKARGYYTIATQLDPHNGTAFTKRGHVNSFLGNYLEARADYARAFEAGQAANKSFLQNYRAFVSIYEGKPEQAVTELLAIVDSVDELPLDEKQRDGARLFALTNAATIAMHSGMHDEAQRILKRRTAQIRENITAVGTDQFRDIQEANIEFMAGQLAARRGDMRAAEKHAKKNKSLVEKQSNPRKMENYHALMGLIDLQQERFESAVDHYRKADLTSVYVKHHLALALSGAGEGGEARRMFTEVANFNFNSVGYALIREDATERSA